jgi:hypothetical protein
MFGFALSGVLLGLAPHFAPKPAPAGIAREDADGRKYVTLVLAAIALLEATVAGLSVPLLLAAAAVSTVCGNIDRTRIDPPAFFGAFVAVVTSAALLWWRPIGAAPTLPTATQWLAFAALTAVAAQSLKHAGAPAAHDRAWPALVVYALAAAAVCFSIAWYRHPIAASAAWHHWGEYVAPAQLLRAGAHPLASYPLPQGWGPLVLLSAVCGKDCWTAVHPWVASLTVLYALAIGYLAVRTRPDAWPAHALVAILLLAFAASLWWTAFPPIASSPVTYPSVAALRFLPVLALACVIAAGDRFDGAPRWRWRGHLAWGACALWSPESALCASLVWWPWFAWARVAGRPAGRAKAVELGAVAAESAGIALATVALWLLSIRLIGGAYPNWAMIGMPWPAVSGAPHADGPLLFSVGVFAVGFCAAGWTLFGQGDGLVFRRLLLSLLLWYGAGAFYFLENPHDNNLLNLMPFHLLVLIATLRAALPTEWRLYAATLAGASLGWAVCFGWGLWEHTLNAKGPFEYGPVASVTAFSRSDPVIAAYLREAHRGRLGDIAYAKPLEEAIAKRYGESVAYLDPIDNAGATRGVPPWSALDAGASSLPAEARRAVLAATARDLGRCGWLIVDTVYLRAEPSAAALLGDIDSAYAVDREQLVGDYRAVRYRPRALVQCPAAAAHSGR